MITPIRPSDIKIQKIFPDEVIATANELLIKKAKNSGRRIYASFTKKEFIGLIRTKNCDITETYLIQNNFLDIEPIFEEYGWNVIYEHPCIGEKDFEPFFKFESKS